MFTSGDNTVTPSFKTTPKTSFKTPKIGWKGIESVKSALYSGILEPDSEIELAPLSHTSKPDPVTKSAPMSYMSEPEPVIVTE